MHVQLARIVQKILQQFFWAAGEPVQSRGRRESGEAPVLLKQFDIDAEERRVRALGALSRAAISLDDLLYEVETSPRVLHIGFGGDSGRRRFGREKRR